MLRAEKATLLFLDFHQKRYLKLTGKLKPKQKKALIKAGLLLSPEDYLKREITADNIIAYIKETYHINEQ